MTITMNVSYKIWVNRKIVLPNYDPSSVSAKLDNPHKNKTHPLNMLVENENTLKLSVSPPFMTYF